MTIHQHRKFGSVTVVDGWWDHVTTVTFEGVSVDCQLVDMSAESASEDVIPRLDLMALVIDGLEGYVAQARKALGAQFGTSENFEPWVKSIRRTLREKIGLADDEDITAEKTAAIFQLSHLLVQKDPLTDALYNPRWHTDFEIELSLTYPNERKSYAVRFNADGNVTGVNGPSTSIYFPENVEISTPDFVHDVLGKCDGENLSPVKIGGRDVEVSLYMSAEQYEHLEPSDLDEFVPLIKRLEEFDTLARAAVPAEAEDYFCDLWDADAYQNQVKAVFPDMTGPKAVSEDQVREALWIQRLSLSLDVSGSGGGALSIDYKILPENEDFPDFTVFCARFAPDGKFLGVAQES